MSIYISVHGLEQQRQDNYLLVTVLLRGHLAVQFTKVALFDKCINSFEAWCFFQATSQFSAWQMHMLLLTWL